MTKLVRVLKTYYYTAAPFLIASYTVLFLYVQNQHEYKTGVLVFPLAVALILTAIVLGIAKLVFRSLDRAVFLTSIVVFLCLSYGRLLELFENVRLKIGSVDFTSEMLVAIGVGILVMLAIIFILKTKKRFINFNQFLAIIVSFLVLFQVYGVISFEVSSGRLLRAESEKIITSNTTKQSKTPDIYYFIFDRYAGPTSTTEQYGFDNSEIYKYLESKGFFVSKTSRSNYPKTFLSLGSSLNMEYLDTITAKTNGGASKDESLVTPLIENSKVLAFLKDHGYTYVHVGSWWEQTKKNKNADYAYAPVVKEYWGADEFTTGFYNTTIARSLIKFILKDPKNVSSNPDNNNHRNAALYQFQVLKEIPSIRSPKFVFVHVLLPHDPFVFDKNCKPISEKIVQKNSHQVNYINQLQCVNTHIKEIIDNLTKDSQNMPIIVLQSDEGPFPMNSSVDANQSWGKATDIALREKFPILNAYLFPGKEVEETELYDGISPVNSFKVLFNTYFGTEYELEEDKSYIFEDKNNYYKFKDVTGIVR